MIKSFNCSYKNLSLSVFLFTQYSKQWHNSFIQWRCKDLRVYYTYIYIYIYKQNWLKFLLEKEKMNILILSTFFTYFTTTYSKGNYQFVFKFLVQWEEKEFIFCVQLIKKKLFSYIYGNFFNFSRIKLDLLFCNLTRQFFQTYRNHFYYLIILCIILYFLI